MTQLRRTQRSLAASSLGVIVQECVMVVGPQPDLRVSAQPWQVLGQGMESSGGSGSHQ